MDSSPLIAGLELLFRRYNITTGDELAMLLRQDGKGVADYITNSENRQAVYKRWSSWQQSQPSANNASTAQASVQATTVGTAIGIQLDSRSVAAQTTNIMDVVDVDTAERILAEALSSTSITEMSGASTAAYVQNSDASCDPVERICPILWCRSLLLRWCIDRCRQAANVCLASTRQYRQILVRTI